MVRTRQLVSFEKRIVGSTAGATLCIASGTPAGMKRWVTFLEFDTPYAGAGGSYTSHGGVFYVASVTSAQAAALTTVIVKATGNRKLRVNVILTQNSVPKSKDFPVKIPRVPNVDSPLFSIAAGTKYLAVMLSKASRGWIKGQYFDE